MILVIIVPFILTSCGEDEKDKMKEIILGGGDEEIDRALTLSIWLPTDAISFEGKTADFPVSSEVKAVYYYKSLLEIVKIHKGVSHLVNVKSAL